MIATAPALDFADLWQQYHGKIRAYIYRKTSDPTLSEDLCSDVFLKAIDSTQRGTEVENLSGWLHRIAHNLVIDTYRARDRQPTVDLEAIPDIPDKDTPHERVMQTLDSEVMRRALDRLTNDQAEVLELRYLDDYEFGEIAAIMGKSEGAIKALALRAKDTLHLRLSGEQRPRPEYTVMEDIAAVLRQQGPLTIRELTDATQWRGKQISSVLYYHSDLFAKVGQRDAGKVTMFLWGLVGFHDHDRREAA